MSAVRFTRQLHDWFSAPVRSLLKLSESISYALIADPISVLRNLVGLTLNLTVRLKVDRVYQLPVRQYFFLLIIFPICSDSPILRTLFRNFFIYRLLHIHRHQSHDPLTQRKSVPEFSCYNHGLIAESSQISQKKIEQKGQVGF